MKSLNLAFIFAIFAMIVFGGVEAFAVEDMNEIAPSPAMQNAGVIVTAPAAAVASVMVSVVLWFF
ncbi:hypothetical protein QJS10_CPB12g00552 [Acorus calamus]|uniref:Uncharacterized protein n=1 Tax=Acorus calamus TaxID=4465 RepID=A0AAV9DK95_ACOCL|nr:hypothetical protein QJS10_CPB12g00552 [Acorus calamus]